MRRLRQVDPSLVKTWMTRRKNGIWINPDQELFFRATEQGNFTIIELYDPHMIQVGIGASKRRPDDKPRRSVGVDVAIWRALDDANRQRHARATRQELRP